MPKRKKKEGVALLDRRQLDFEQLVQLAGSGGESKVAASWPPPKWWQIGRWLQENPCMAVECKRDDAHAPSETDRGAVAGAGIVASLLSLIGTLVSSICISWKLVGLAVIPVFFFLCFIYRLQKYAWEDHGSALRERQQQAPQNPGEVVVVWLTDQLAQTRQRFLAEDAPMPVLRGHLEKRFSQVRTLAEQLRARFRQRDGEQRAVMKSAVERADALANRIRVSREQVEQHLAQLTAYFDECDARVHGLREPLDDLSLLRRLQAQEAAAREEIGRAETLIVQSVEDLRRGIGELRERIENHLPPALTGMIMDASSADLEADLDRLDGALTQVFELLPSPPRLTQG